MVIAGITAGLLLAMRYAQMVNQGKAVGQQLSTISEGAGRYMKQYSKNILALDARCAEPALQVSGGPVIPPDPTNTPPDCKLVLGDVTVANGYQPTVEELRRLELVRANDQLMLPFSPGIAVDRRTGEPALARVAVWIRPVRHTAAAGDPAGGARLLSASRDLSGFASALSGVSAAAGGGVQPGTRPALDMPPSMNGVSCYNGRFTNASTVVDATRVFANAQDPHKVYRSDTPESFDAAMALVRQGVATLFFGGESYCRYMQENYGEGIFGGSAGTPPDGGPGDGTGGTAGDAWTLESVVFNTQPYYYGAATLPIGAAAQVGAALEQAGYAGRLSMLKASLTDSRQMRGLYGHSLSDNPIQSKDGSKGLPGILAAVTLLADSESASGGGTGGGTGGLPTWDAAGNNLYNASLVQGQQIAGETAVVGSGVSALPTNGRSAVMAVNGNMVMGHNTVIMANNLEGNQLQAKELTSDLVTAKDLKVTGTTLKLGQLGKDAAFNFYMRNGTNIRLPRVDPGTLCDPNADLASSRTVLIINNTTHMQPMAMTRFLLFCKPDRNSGTSTLEFGRSHWSSPEYEAMLAKYPPSSHRWFYFDSAPTDSANPTWEPR